MEGRRLRDEHLEPLERERNVQTDRPNVREPDPPEGGGVGLLEDALRRWQEAEDRLHPIAVASPELYERSLELVRAIAGELAPIATRTQLLEAERDAAAAAARAIDRAGLRTEGLDVPLATRAAFAIRARSLASEEAAADRRNRVRAAEERGDDWVVIERTGDGVMSPFRGLEMHLPDGAGLATWIEVDLEGGPASYSVQEVALDPRTGSLLDPAAPGSEPATFGDRTSWEAAVAELKRGLVERPS
jgi:hypothetical protein